MRRQRWNAFVRLLMVVALLATGYPLAAPLWNRGPLPARPKAATDVLDRVPTPTTPVAGQVLVDAKDTITPAEIAALGTRHGLAFRYNSAHSGAEEILVADVPPGQEAALLARLRADPLVEAAEPVDQYQAFFTPNDPRFKEQWHHQLVGAEKAWERATGKGITVAVIDTGVSRARDFTGTKFAKGYDFVNDDDDPSDDHGHGTHVAGTIAETTNNGEGVAGLAFDAAIMPLKVLDEWGSGNVADIADAIRYAADHGAKIINMSLGGPFPNKVMQDACAYARDKGVLVVCAAGNSMGGPVGYPAAYPECMAVSAVGPKGELSWYSSIGKEVAIAGPGGDMKEGEQGGVLQNTVLHDTGEPEDDYFFFQGTSMASPHVAAAAALAMSRGVTDPGEVRNLLQRAAQRKGPPEQYGAGVMSAVRTTELADAARRHSLLRFGLAILLGIWGLASGMLRRPARGLLRFPWVPVGLIIGILGPDLIFGWIGFGSPFNILLHSALIPLYLLWEVENRPGYRFVAAMALGLAVHLGWDALHGHTPFPHVLPDHAMPWLWVNVVLGAGVMFIAWARSAAAE